MPGHASQHVGGEGSVSIKRTPGLQLLCAAHEVVRPAPHRRRVDLPQAVESVETQALGQPCHRRGRNTGALGLFAHREQRNIFGIVEHPACRHTMLRGQSIEQIEQA